MKTTRREVLVQRVDAAGACAAALAASVIVLQPTTLRGRAPTRLVDEPPVLVSAVAPGVVLVDFGRVAFGNLRLTPPAGASATVTVHFGEALADGRVNRTPPGSVRYAQAQVALAGAETVVAPPPDARNTRQVGPDDKPDRNGYVTPPAVLTPAAWGVVLPFRWVEIEGWPGELAPGQIRRQSAFAASWDDDAAAFRSSDGLLDRIWELCRYSIKATTFAGVYVDGDRERIPYEADAYLNQLSHYATDRDRQMARDTFDWLVQHPTWPTEWRAHMVFMAHADWMDSGDRAWLSARYDVLKSKLLFGRTRADGLVTSDEAAIRQGDLVDWPAGERDGFVFTSVNTVVNAFHLRTLALMAELATAIGRDDGRGRRIGRARPRRAPSSRRRSSIPRAASTGTGRGPSMPRCTPTSFRWPSAWSLEEQRERVTGLGAISRHGVFGLCRAVPARGPVRERRQRRSPGADHGPHRPQLGAHARERHDDHLGGLGPEVQAEPGLESCLGRGASQPASPVRARRAAAHPGLAARADPTAPGFADPRRGEDPDTARTGPRQLDARAPDSG